MENPMKMDDLGGKPTILGNTHIHLEISHPLSHPSVPINQFLGSDEPGSLRSGAAGSMDVLVGWFPSNRLHIWYPP